MKSAHPIVKGVLLSLLSLGMTAGVVAKDKSEHDSIREALRRGEVLPLEKILDIAAMQVPGDVIEVELERRKDRTLIYEIKILTQSGRVREIKIDARTGVVLTIEDD